MNDTEALAHLGQLVVNARVELKKSQLGFSKEVGVDVQTLRSIEKGIRLPLDVNMGKIERGLGWRAGSMREVWEEREHTPKSKVTLEEMRRGAGESTWQDLDKEINGGPVMKASLLSDEELLAEISYRFRNYKVQRNGES